ncbi:MAG: hypothetical protein AAB443_04365 [Patescibacteria group bacterium]
MFLNYNPTKSEEKGDFMDKPVLKKKDRPSKPTRGTGGKPGH